ncbi:MAG TPA: xanthine dehydrogenase family protein molybdopterin-binding subunit [Stellaceae bacterium]|nr:xanthine dehydrogenase family protein molybdopterin-binding subunit [Stellaceae bacterium]
MSGDGIGAAVRRKEDARFLRGRGNYTDDINRPGQLYAYILRSPHAHADLGAIDTSKAKRAPGVVAVFTGADLAADNVGGLPCGWLIKNKDGSPMVEPPHPVLAQGRVRHVGDPVAVVIAESRNQAKDAAEQISVSYKELPAITDAAEAIKPGKPQLFEAAKNNLCYDWHIGEKDAVDAALKKAAHVTRIDIVNNRLVPNAMEPRSAIGEYDRGTGEYTLYTTSQNPHVIRLLMGAFVLHLPEHKLKVVAPDVGGGFGSKIYHYAEEAFVTWASAKVGKPVKWTAERSESFISDAQGRDHVTHAELALDKDGKFLALKVSTVANMGGYLSTFAPAIPTYLYATLLAGTYTTPAVYCEVKAVFTNTVPVDAYRGAGRPEATYVVERIVETAAREMKIDPAELRRRNYVPKNAYPYQTPVALQYDSGDYFTTLDMALKAADYAGFEKRRQEAAKHGKLRGIGLASYIEACGIAPSAVAGALGARAGLYETAEVRVHPTGSITMYTGTHSHGQGHETTFAQLISDRLGVPIEQIEVVHGDTSKIPFGMGTYGSRSLAVGGSALVKAMDKIVNKGKKIAAHLLEAAEADIEFKDGKFTVAGTDRSKAFGEIAFAAYVPHNYPIETVEPGLDETAFYDPKNFTFPSGTHVAEVEIDRDTGAVHVVGFAAADDFGRIINPLIVEGQVHGGLAQGIGQALCENTVYNDDGQLVTGSYMDYCMPRADNLPSFSVATNVTLCTHNPLGVKGCGEAGAIGAPAAIMNAVVNALAPLGVKDLAMPATPERVWRAIHGGQRQAAD